MHRVGRRGGQGLELRKSEKKKKKKKRNSFKGDYIKAIHLRIGIGAGPGAGSWLAGAEYYKKRMILRLGCIDCKVVCTPRKARLKKTKAQ